MLTGQRDKPDETSGRNWRVSERVHETEGGQTTLGGTSGGWL